MNNVPHWLCQTFCWLLMAACSPASLRGADAPAATPPPPPWRVELDAAQALQASLLLVPPKDAADEAARHGHLAQIYRDLAAKYPSASPVQKAAGDGLAQLETPEIAIPFWLRAAALDPADAELADSLGSTYLRMGQVKLAAEQYQRAVAVRPDLPAYHFALANVLYLFRRELISPPAIPDEQAALRLALEHFRRAAELSPGDLRLAKAYAETFYIFAKPDWAQALDAWQTVLSLSGEDEKAFARSHLARISLRLGRGADARAYLAEIHDPNFDPLKTKLLKQADKLEAISPSPSP